jgi:alginate O-acetyltransferase complex protein AlgI
MVFSSVIFLFLFLPLTLCIHYILPFKFKNLFLFTVSVLFYAWGEGALTLLILLSIGINYLAGLGISFFQNQKPVWAALLLAFAITLNLSVLIYFKYFHFIIENIQRLGLFTNQLNPYMHLPIGISFYTFHIISYLMDVYRRDTAPQKNPLDLGLYIFLFPQLVAGPIIRYKDISSKIASRFILGEAFWYGVKRFIRGLAKKIIIANTLAITADAVFNLKLQQPASMIWLGAICYTLQIYFDFSGYSDMALGLGKMMGFQFPENFNYPYCARSLQDFWQRWHISLSTWFRDYLYIPLGGNKKGALITYRNLCIVFFITGLWHGSSWNFIAWGMFHGLFLILERIGLKTLLQSCHSVFQHLYTLLIVVIAWVFFRAENLTQALHILKQMFVPQQSENYAAIEQINAYSLFVFVLALIVSFKARHYIAIRYYNVYTKLQMPFQYLIQSFQFILYMGLFVYCLAELSIGNYNPFIYFRF